MTGPLKKTEGMLGPAPAVPEAVPDAVSEAVPEAVPELAAVGAGPAGPVGNAGPPGGASPEPEPPASS